MLLMAEIKDSHRKLAHDVFMMGELHGREELKKAIAQAIADAEERGKEVENHVERDSTPETQT